jgi:hypothetical protein
MGWFWFYGTIKPPTKTSSGICYFISLTRTELGNPTIRKEMGLKIGQTTTYSIGIGFSVNGKWHYTDKYNTIKGRYQSLERGTFKFDSIVEPGHPRLNIDASKIGLIDMKGSFNGYDVHAIQYSSQLPYFNNKNGCSPCLGGQGTLYWSWTAMKCDIDISTGGKIIATGKGGDAWIDVQWGGGNYSRNIMAQFLNNSKRVTSSAGADLGKYIWVNLHLPNNEQYMIYQFLDDNQAKNEDEVINCFYNVYTGSKLEPKWMKNLNITIKKYADVKGVNYPSVYEIHLPNGKNVTLDSRSFGHTVMPEIGNSTHWNGSGLIYDDNGNIIGTGFLEASQFDDPTFIIHSRLKGAGVSSENFSIFQGGEITFCQFLPSYLVVNYQVILYVLIMILFVCFIWYMIKFIKK